MEARGAIPSREFILMVRDIMMRYSTTVHYIAKQSGVGARVVGRMTIDTFTKKIEYGPDLGAYDSVFCNSSDLMRDCEGRVWRAGTPHVLTNLLTLSLCRSLQTTDEHRKGMDIVIHTGIDIREHAYGCCMLGGGKRVFIVAPMHTHNWGIWIYDLNTRNFVGCTVNDPLLTRCGIFGKCDGCVAIDDHRVLIHGDTFSIGIRGLVDASDHLAIFDEKATAVSALPVPMTNLFRSDSLIHGVLLNDGRVFFLFHYLDKQTSLEACIYTDADTPMEKVIICTHRSIFGHLEKLSDGQVLIIGGFVVGSHVEGVIRKINYIWNPNTGKATEIETLRKDLDFDTFYL